MKQKWTEKTEPDR